MMQRAGHDTPAFYRLLITFLFLAAWRSSPAQPAGRVSISGRVSDSSDVPIGFANVILPDGRRFVATADGRFAFTADSSTRSLEIRRIGFRPLVVELTSLPDTALRVLMVPQPVTLERVRVESAMRVQSLTIRGFYERQAELEKGINTGFFITPEDIERRPAGRITDFLHGQPGIKVRMVNEVGRDGRTGLQPQGLDGCRMEIYVDGIRFYLNGPKDAPKRGGINFINDLVPTNDVAAIEVYPRAVAAPPKYQPFNGTCGVMLIWTK